MIPKINDINTAQKHIDNAVIAGIVITVLTGLLMILLALMKMDADKVTLPVFHYYQITYILIAGGLTYGIYKKNPLSAVFLLFVFLIDKFLLMNSSLLSPFIGAVVLIIFWYYLIQGVRGTFAYKRLEKENQELSNEKKIDSESTKKAKTALKDSFIYLTLFCIIAIISNRIFDMGVENSLADNISTWFYIASAISAIGIASIGYLMTIKQIRVLLGKLHFAVANLVLIAIATTLTTFIPQHGTVPNQPLKYYPETFGHYLGNVFIKLDLHSIFHSWWFIGLFVILIINIIIVISKRPFKLRFIGFHITHLSIIVILLAVWFNYFYSFNGILPLKEGRINNVVQFYPQSRQKFKRLNQISQIITGDKKSEDYYTRNLDFFVKLDKFSSKKYEADYRIYVKKFDMKLPETIGIGTYQNMFKYLQNDPAMIPGLRALQQHYVLKERVSPRALLSILSSIAVTYNSIYETRGQKYIFHKKVDVKTKQDGKEITQSKTITKKEINDILLVLKKFGYKGKDIAANPIVEGKEEVIFTSPFKYTIKKYYKDYYEEIVPIPNHLSEGLYKEILSKIPVKRKPVIEAAYEGANGKYQLKQNYLKDHSLRMTLAGVFYEAEVPKDLLSGEMEVNNPVLTIALRNGPSKGETFLQGTEGTKVRNSYINQNLGFEVKFLWDADTKQINDFLEINKKKDKSPHFLTLFKDNKKVVDMNIELGKEYSIPNTDYKFVFKDFYNHFKIDDKTNKPMNASKENTNPAVQLTIKKKSSNDVMVAKLFHFGDQLGVGLNETIKKAIGYDLKYQLKMNYSRKFFVSGKDKLIYIANDGKLIKKEPFVFNQPYNITDRSYFYINQLYINSGQVEAIPASRYNVPDSINGDAFKDILSKLKDEKHKQVLNKCFGYRKNMRRYLFSSEYLYNREKRKTLSEAFETANYVPAPNKPMVVLEFNRSKDESRTIALSAHVYGLEPIFVIPDSKYTISFNSRKQHETEYWKSNLSVIEFKDNKMKEHEVKATGLVKVNEYMYYNGYRFYQTDYDEKDPTYSGIGVTIEPGLPYIYGAFITLSLGIMIMFYFSPKRKNRDEV